MTYELFLAAMNILASEGKSRRPETITLRKTICVSRPLSMKKAARITFAHLKLNPPEHNLPAREKNSLEKAVFWHEVKAVCCLPTPFLDAKLITYQCIQVTHNDLADR